MEQSNSEEINKFIQRSVLVLCGAGTDRSKLISDELDERGYHSIHRGVNWGNNFVEEEDLNFIGTIVFSSINEKNEFDKRYEKLKKIITKKGIVIRILNITESDKNRAFQTEKIIQLKDQIKRDLDAVGLIDLSNDGG